MRRAATLTLAILTLALLASACSPVSQVAIHDDFDKVDKHATYRLEVTVAPVKPADEAVGKLYGKIARRYANDHRDFIVRGVQVSAERRVTKASCEGSTEGVLWLKPTFRVVGEDVHVRVVAELRRCKGWVRIWRAVSQGTWPSRDPQLAQLTAQYTREVGEGAKIHAAPAFRALRALVDTMPRPKLIKDADIDEKIDL